MPISAPPSCMLSFAQLRKSIQVIFLSCCLVLLLLVPAMLLAQSGSATLSGTITDVSGALVPNVSITITNEDTNVSIQSQSNRAGIYNVPGLNPGRYRILVEKQGFKQVDVRNMTLNVQDIVSRNFTLEVGGTSETIQVDGSGVNINTTDGSVGTVIDRAFVENTPLNGRSFQDLILLTPGVVTQSPQSSQAAGAYGDFSINGQRTESNYYMVDGVSANTATGVNGGLASAASGGNVSSSTILGTTQSLVSVDALQEFRVNSSSYSAEYGRTPGGQLSFVTRSGTDSFHGTVYDYLRNSYFDANNWFSDYLHTAEPALRQNDFGGTLGGPVTIPHLYDGKARTFFFVSYEGLRLAQPQVASVQYVPSNALRQEAPAALQSVLNAFPLPTVGGTDYGNGLAEFIQADSLPSQIDSTSVRLDHSLSSKLKLFFRFSDTPSSAAARNLSQYEPQQAATQTYTLGATAQIKNNISNEFRLGYSHSQLAENDVIDGFGGAQPTNLGQDLYGANGSALFLLYFPGGSGSSALEPYITSSRMNQWNITDTVAWLRGHHQIKAGIDYRNINFRGQEVSPLAEYIYLDQSEIQSNQAFSAIGQVQLPGTPINHEFSAFVQDEWHPLQALTISMGARWELNPPPGGANGSIPYTLLGNIGQPASLSLAPQGTPLWKTTWYNIAPRLGAAWVANNTPDHQTVLRAGGGVFFDTDNGISAKGYGGVGFGAFNSISNAPVPFPGGINTTSIPISITPPYTNAIVSYPYPHLQLPYTLEWSSALEQQLGRSQSLAITYVGSNGRRLIKLNEFSLGALNPNFGTVIEYGNGLTSNYQALQVKFQRTVAHGLQALASYSWSHSLDYESNNATLNPVRGNSDFDVRNNFSAGATWQIPNAHHDMITNAVFDDWALDGHFVARTAFPVTLYGQTQLDPATGNEFSSGLDLVPNQPIYLHVQGVPGNRQINAAAFTQPTDNLEGNAPRNFVRGFGAAQVNLAVRREFHLREHLGLQFRAETFNILNHPNFGLIDSTLGDNTFGQATQTLNQSLTTVSPLYQMGGPRSMQFALKLQF